MDASDSPKPLDEYLMNKNPEGRMAELLAEVLPVNAIILRCG